MPPTFRTDLVCSREEQQGVVFYRIDDPKSQTSFRLYEIEYLIAKKLDGVRTQEEVIAAVKSDFNFDITVPDLQRFINQLESMGFLMGSGGDAGGPVPEALNQAPRADGPPIDLLPPTEVSGAATDTDKAELDRLLRSALLHVKQGYIVHARDYFLAAKELKPSDERLQKLVNHLEIIGDASGPAEVEYLWNQAKELFPELAAEVEPMAASKAAAESTATGASAEGNRPWEEDLRSRIVWTLVLLLVLVAGVGGLVWVIKAARIFEKAARVKVVTVKADRIPIFYDKPASDVKPLQEAWLNAPSAGKIAEVLVTNGSRVEASAVLLTLELPPLVAKELAAAKDAVTKANAVFEKTNEKTNQLLAEREAIEAERATAEDKLKELRPKSLLRQGGVSKRDLEKYKRLKVAANKKLTALAKKERGPKAAKAKAQKQRDAAVKKLEMLEKKVTNKLVRAPFSGLAVDVKAVAGQTVAVGDKLLLFRDPAAVELVFIVEKAPDLQAGGETHVAVGGGKPSRAKVTNVAADANGTKVAVKLADPSGGFIDMQPAKFRLVREFAEPAFRVPTSALIETERGVRVIVSVQKRAMERDIVVLDRDAASAVIKDPSGSLRDGEQIAVNRLDDGEVSSIAAGSFLEIEGD